jgi:hypothetical protein
MQGVGSKENTELKQQGLTLGLARVSCPIVGRCQSVGIGRFLWSAETTNPSSSLKSSAIGTNGGQRGLFPGVADLRVSVLQHYEE